MTDDYLGFGDEAERRAAVGPAFISRPPMGPSELLVAEQMSRRDDIPAASVIVFTTISEDGVEEWDPPSRGRIGEGERWQKIMGWEAARVPTIEEAQAFQLNARMSRVARWWDRLAAARAEDEAAARPARAVKPEGGPERPGSRKAAPEGS